MENSGQFNGMDSKEALDSIIKYIDEKGLTGHSFHIYILPFTDLSENRKNILKELIT